MQEDKIFNNTYGESDPTENPISFVVSPTFADDADPDDRMHYELLSKRVDELIKGSEFEHINEVTQGGVIKKLNKVQINKVFFFIIVR